MKLPSPTIPLRITTTTEDIEREIFRQSPALAVASKILGGIQKTPESLADKFVQSTYDWTKHFDYTAHEAKIVQPIVDAYRRAMRQANRFVLDNQFVQLATHVASSVPPEKLLYRLQFATLPYDVTWIEFNLRVKTSTMRALHGLGPIDEQVPGRLGLLLERVDSTMATCTLVSEDSWSGGMAGRVRLVTAPNLTGYMFSMDERTLRFDQNYNGLTPFDPKYRFDRLSSDTKLDFTALMEEEPEAEDIMYRIANGSLWGYGNFVRGGMVENSRELIDHIRLPEHLKKHGELAFSRFYDYFEHANKARMKTMPTLSKLINIEVTEFSGMMRWIVCVLAMLNEVPVLMRQERPRHTVKAGLTRRVQAMDYHVVTLRLPKTKPLPWIERKLSNSERRHKAHEVRSHWRTYLNTPHCRQDEHAWEYDNEQGYRLCGRCMSFSRQIHEHVRGDVSLGWVNKSYVIKPS